MSMAGRFKDTMYNVTTQYVPYKNTLKQYTDGHILENDKEKRLGRDPKLKLGMELDG